MVVDVLRAAHVLTVAAQLSYAAVSELTHHGRPGMRHETMTAGRHFHLRRALQLERLNRREVQLSLAGQVVSHIYIPKSRHIFAKIRGRNSRRLAAGIPGARLVTLDDAGYLLMGSGRRTGQASDRSRREANSR